MFAFWIGEEELETSNYVSPIEDDDVISASDVGESVQTDDLFDSYTEEEDEEDDISGFFAEDADDDSFDI